MVEGVPAAGAAAARRNRALPCAAAAVLQLLAAAAVAADPPASAPHFERVELSPHDRLLDVTARDLDGDGRPELLVASAENLGERSVQRHLTLYRFAGAAAQPEVWRELSVPDDAVAYAAGDVLGRGRAQILYLAPQAVFALDLESNAVTKVVGEHRLLATLASPRALPFWDGLRDLDGDGLADLILPDATGYAIYRQEPKGVLACTGRIEAGSAYAAEPFTRRGRRSRSQNALVNLRAVNQIGVGDTNADRRLDLIALQEDHVLGFAQGPGLRFASAPSFRRLLVSAAADPFAELGESTPPDIQVGDLDGDGRVDFVVPELDVRELSTRLRVFLSAADGPPAKPTQILKLSSLGSEPQLTDMNGDGSLDLGITTVRVDRLGTLAHPSVQKLDFSYYAFLFKPATKAFSVRPDLQWDVSVELAQTDERAREAAPAASEGGARRDDDGARSGFMRLDGDFTGDGVHDLARLSARGEVTVFLGAASGADRMQLRVADQPMLSAQVRPTDRADIQDVDGDGRSDVLLLYEDALILLVTRG